MNDNTKKNQEDKKMEFVPQPIPVYMTTYEAPFIFGSKESLLNDFLEYTGEIRNNQELDIRKLLRRFGQAHPDLYAEMLGVIESGVWPSEDKMIYVHGINAKRMFVVTNERTLVAAYFAMQALREEPEKTIALVRRGFSDFSGEKIDAGESGSPIIDEWFEEKGFTVDDPSRYVFNAKMANTVLARDVEYVIANGKAPKKPVFKVGDESIATMLELYPLEALFPMATLLMFLHAANSNESNAHVALIEELRQAVEHPTFGFVPKKEILTPSNVQKDGQSKEDEHSCSYMDFLSGHIIDDDVQSDEQSNIDSQDDKPQEGILMIPGNELIYAAILGSGVHPSCAREMLATLSTYDDLRAEFVECLISGDFPEDLIVVRGATAKSLMEEYENCSLVKAYFALTKLRSGVYKSSKNAVNEK